MDDGLPLSLWKLQCKY